MQYYEMSYGLNVEMHKQVEVYTMHVQYICTTKKVTLHSVTVAPTVRSVLTVSIVTSTAWGADGSVLSSTNGTDLLGLTGCGLSGL